MRKEATRREFFREHQSSAAINRSERAQKLRRRPAERPEIVEPIVGADAKTLGQWVDIREIFAKIQNHALGLGAGSGGEEDNGVVFGPPRPSRFARRTARQLAEQRFPGRII